MRFRRRVQRPVALGPLEVRVLEHLWNLAAPATVRAVQGAFPDLAYTTVMTTMGRLHRKRVLERTLAGRAFVYRALVSKEQLAARIAAEEIVNVLPVDGPRRPVLSMLLDAVHRHDAALLEELELLIHARRRRGDTGGRR